MLTLYVMFAWLLGFCYGFVLLSSAALQTDSNLYEVGNIFKYDYHSSVLMSETEEGVKKVGFLVTGTVTVENIANQEGHKILKVKLKEPQLHIRSRKSPTPEGFVQHTSRLDRVKAKPFYLNWRTGKVTILLEKSEEISVKNLKKGIASLFQFQFLDGETNETDSSGVCSAKYNTQEDTKLQKIKTNCAADQNFGNPSGILESIVKSSRYTHWEFDTYFGHILKTFSRERHQIYHAANEDLGNLVEAEQVLTFTQTDSEDHQENSSPEDVLGEIRGRGYHEESLQIEIEPSQEDELKLQSTLNDFRENLKTDNLGSLVAAKGFSRVLDAAKLASKEEISKILHAKKNLKILPQIYDVLGHIQSEDCHQAVMKNLHFDKEEHLDLAERYLWALSTNSHPNPEIVADLLKRHLKNDNFPAKIKETLLLSLASMARKIPQITTEDIKIYRNVHEAILNGLDYAKNEDRFQFLRALKNLQNPATIPLLGEIIKSGNIKEGVLAFKTLTSFPAEFWDDKVQNWARRIFLELDRKSDSSARTLAVDILLETRRKCDETLEDFLHYLKSNDTSFEVKQYVFQKLKMIAEEDSDFAQKLWERIKQDSSLNNYSVLAPRGLSTVLKRDFQKSGKSFNGSLVSIQEIFSGIVKRGLVNVVLDKNGPPREMFSLGIFAGGLSSFTGGDSEEEEIASAGLELTILNTQIRPFVFFTGQGELMGHVWSGTASEKTPAFQATILLEDTQGPIRLGTGFTAQLSSRIVISFDLSGKIEISLWGRTADALVQKEVAILATGQISVETDFAKSKTEFSASLEPKLSIKSDIDFSAGVNLCMQVLQPQVLFKHNIFKVERIPGTQHRLRISNYKKYLVPGATYALNRKNSEMCSAMFSHNF